jgi:hypothetical protein
MDGPCYSKCGGKNFAFPIILFAVGFNTPPLGAVEVCVANDMSVVTPQYNKFPYRTNIPRPLCGGVVDTFFLINIPINFRDHGA